MSRRGRTPTVSLREALSAIHRDPQWWLLCLGYGFAAATGFGMPLAAGFVMESLDNSRRGYPTPLPPWSDPVTRFLTGFFAILVDFTFFILPLLVGGLLIVCSSIGLVIGAFGQPVVTNVITLLMTAAVAFVVAMFFLGVSPVGRLRFAREGRIEDALSAATWRWSVAREARGPFLRARVASLPAYLPAAAMLGVTVGLATLSFPGQAAAIAVGLWLTMAALVYAHLVVVQLYVAAEKDVQYAALGM